MSDGTEDPSQPPEVIGPTQLEVWHRIAAVYGTPTAHVAHHVSAVANGVGSAQEALNEAEGGWEEVLKEQLAIQKWLLEVAQSVFADHLWATRAVPDRDTAEQVAEQLPQQFLDAWKADHPGTPEELPGSEDA